VLCASGILLTTFLVWLITWPWIASWRAARLLRLIHAYRTALHDPAGLCPHDRDIPIGPATPAPAGRPRRLMTIPCSLAASATAGARSPGAGATVGAGDPAARACRGVGEVGRPEIDGDGPADIHDFTGRTAVGVELHHPHPDRADYPPIPFPRTRTGPENQRVDETCRRE